MVLLMKFILTFIVIIFIIYIVQAIFLNKFNKLIYGKKTPLAWIPICNFYLLGKLAFCKAIGWLLVGCLFLTSTYKVKINDVEKTYSLLPSNIKDMFSNVLNIVIFVLYIYAIVKYFKIKKEKQNNTVQTEQLQFDSKVNNLQAEPIQSIKPQINTQNVEPQETLNSQILASNFNPQELQSNQNFNDNNSN